MFSMSNAPLSAMLLLASLSMRTSADAVNAREVQAQSGTAKSARDTIVDADAAIAAQDWKRALAICEALVAKDAKDAHAWDDLGQAQLDLARYDQAVDAFQRAVDLKFFVPRTTYRLARAHAGKGEEDRALEDLRKAYAGGMRNSIALTSAPEFQSMQDDPAFKALVLSLRPCSTPEYRQFDFWLGEWDVVSSTGRALGANSIRPIEGGCAFEEHWTGAMGGTGTSLNRYNAAKGKWQQTWVDGMGTVLELEGEFKDGSMVLSAVVAGAPNRVTWTPLEKDRVRQHWESSSDEGKPWTTVFDGIYVRRQ